MSTIPISTTPAVQAESPSGVGSRNGHQDRYPEYAYEEIVMNVSAVDPTTTAPARAAAAANAPARKPAPPAAAPQVSVAALSTPAATAAISGVPATVKPEDRALYLQILKSVGGNVNAALAALAAKESAEGES
jgi:hypothetical protein